MSQYILGVDPGLSGGLATLDPSNQTIVASSLMPKIKRGNRSELDPYALSKFIEPYCINIKFAVLEDVYAMTGQGTVSMFSFGVTKGMIMGCLGVYGIDIIRVAPAMWKMNMGLSSNKQLSFDLASKLYPLQKDMWKLKKHEGIAEAVLIAHYGLRFYDTKQM